MNKNYLNKFLISVFVASALMFGVSHNDANASFWDWLKVNKANDDSQQVAAVVNAEITYKWVNNGLVSESEGRYTGNSSNPQKKVKTYTCDSSSKGNKLYDGTNRGFSYGDSGYNGISHAWPIYEGENTFTAIEYTYDDSGLKKRTGGQVNEWECKSSNTTSSSSPSSSSSSSSSRSSSANSANRTASTDSVTNLTSTSATLNGTVNPGGENVYYIFAYIKESDFFSSNKNSSTKYPYSYRSIGNGQSDVSVKANISELSSGTKYLYGLFTYNSITKKFVNGEVKSFITSSSNSSNSSNSSVQQYKLTVKKTGFGEVKSEQKDIAGNTIKCGSNCSGSFYENKEVVLTAYPDNGRKFVGWSGNFCSSGGGSNKTCGVKMNSDKKIMADFETGQDDDTNEQPLLVVLSGNGSGSVGDSNGEIQCGNDCVGKYHTQTITLTAKPNSNSEFGGWGGACEGKIKTCRVQINEKDIVAKKVTANFNLKNESSSSSSSPRSSPSSSSSSRSSNYSSSSSASATLTVKTGSVDNITSTSARLKGLINPQGENVYVYFNYRKESESSDLTKATAWMSTGSISNDFAADIGISSLSPGTKYIYRFYAYSYTSGKTVSGDLGSFTTLGGSSNSSSSSSNSSQTTASSAQSATTNSATNVTSTSATLNGTVNPGGENVSYYFTYYKSGVSGATTNTSPVSASGSSNVSATANISSLSPGTTYYYYVVAYSYTTQKTFTGVGSTKSFTTPNSSSSSSSSSASATLTVKTGSVDNITSTSARLKGLINPQGENVYVYFNYRKESESSDLTKATAWMSTGSISNDFAADIGISSLSPGTKYIYRFYAYSYTSGKTVSGDLGSFTTLGSSSSSLSSNSSSATAVSGSCGSAKDICSAGTWVDVADSSTYYYWNCQGSNGGASQTCPLIKPVSPGSSSSSVSSSSSSLPTAYPLTVSKAGTGIGLVAAPGISCPADCAENYPSGTTITLVATPATGTVFAGWIGCNASSGTVCSVLMNTSKSVIANFVKP